MTNTNQTTIDNSSTDPITRHLLEFRSHLIESGSYLGDPAKPFMTNGVWKHIERGHHFVTKVSADTAEKAEQDRTQAATAGRPSTIEDTPMEPLVLSTIALINKDDCWLTPDGHWRSDNKISCKFEDLKMSFTVKTPSTAVVDSLLNQDFTHGIQNAKFLMGQIASGQTPRLNFVVTTKDGNSSSLKFRHIVFEKLSDDDDSDSTASESEETWTMADWPVSSSDASDARDELALTHRPIPLPAYNIAGELIRPEQCPKALPGALVRITFTIAHWFIDNGNSNSNQKNVFVADVQSIRVLIDPPQQVMSPKKRKTARRDPASGSPPKRPHRLSGA